MNVLLTCAGRRAALLRAFQEAVLPWNGRVLAGDRDGLAPALYLADAALRLPDVTSPSYIACLLGLARQHAIRLIVPTIDTELPALAEAAPAFADRDCRVLVSTPGFVLAAADKWAALGAFAGHGIRTVPSWLPEALAGASLPERLVVKPRGSSASLDVRHVRRDQLGHALALVPEPIVQQEITAPEVTIDALFDFEGRLLHYVPRRRIRTLAGESIQGVTLADDALRPWLVAVLSRCGQLGARGPLTVQAFLAEDGPLLSEINPRFGGGFPLTHAAGGHYPAWIVRMLQGEAVAPALGAYTSDLYMTRYHAELFTRHPRWL